MSIFSPPNSLITFLTLCPIGPIQVPLGLICGSWVNTAIFVRCPDSLATATISTTPCKTSGASNSNNPFTKPGWVLDKVICGPF